MDMNEMVKSSKVNSCKELFSIANLKLDKIYIKFSSDYEYPYTANNPISPSEYLKHAKTELHHDPCDRTLLNAINHSNRSIDSSIDEILKCLNIDTSNKKTIASVERIYRKINNTVGDTSINLKLISCIFNAPTILLDGARKIRHSLEHDYKQPETTDVLRAVETAQFFNLFIESKSNSAYQLDITDISLFNAGLKKNTKNDITLFGKEDDNEFDSGIPSRPTGLYFSWDTDENGKTVYSLVFRREVDDTLNVFTYDFDNTEPLLLMFLQACFFDPYDEMNTKKCLESIICELTEADFTVDKYYVNFVELHKHLSKVELD